MLDHLRNKTAFKAEHFKQTPFKCLYRASEPSILATEDAKTQGSYVEKSLIAFCTAKLDHHSSQALFLI